MPRPMRLVDAALAATMLIWASLSHVPTAQAHAIIVESHPRHEESVSPPPRQLVLRFNSRIEKPLCSVLLVGPHQKSIALLRPEADTPPDTLTYSLPPLESGAYQARWKVLAADGHVTEGTVLFTVVAAEPARTR